MSSKFSFYLMLVLSLPIFVEIDEILRLWLKIVPEHTANFVRLILCCSVIDIFRNPMNTSIHATGDIKVFQIWEATTLLLIVPLAYLALKLGYPAESVFVVQLIVFIIVQAERIFIVCPRIKMKKILYVRRLLLPSVKVLFTALIVPASLIIVWPIQPDNYIQLLTYLVLIAISTSSVVYFVGLAQNEKEKVKLIVKNKIGRK